MPKIGSSFSISRPAWSSLGRSGPSSLGKPHPASVSSRRTRWRSSATSRPVQPAAALIARFLINVWGSVVSTLLLVSVGLLLFAWYSHHPDPALPRNPDDASSPLFCRARTSRRPLGTARRGLPGRDREHPDQRGSIPWRARLRTTSCRGWAGKRTRSRSFYSCGRQRAERVAIGLWLCNLVSVGWPRVPWHGPDFFQYHHGRRPWSHAGRHGLVRFPRARPACRSGLGLDSRHSRLRGSFL